jgi:tRNA 2-selenouridine synthase
VSITKINIEHFIGGSRTLVIDVRSPAEYIQAHIPGAVSIPIFDNDERKHIGTTYKQQSRELAIKIGLDYFGKNMRPIVEMAENITQSFFGFNKSNSQIVVHCWRGGMRSQAVAWLLDLYGYNVAIIIGGYKAYRRWVLSQFEKEYYLHILGGFTGSGKTAILKHLKDNGNKTIDLEKIAKHKGSAFGGLDGDVQPTQEMFENLLADALYSCSHTDGPIWLEDESQRIGHINIPANFWKTMRRSKLFFLDLPFEDRLDSIVDGYGKYPKEKIINAIVRMQKRLGGLETKTAISYLVEDNIKECFRVLLLYYDKHYKRALEKRDTGFTTIKATAQDNIAKLLTTTL